MDDIHRANPRDAEPFNVAARGPQGEVNRGRTQITLIMAAMPAGQQVKLDLGPNMTKRIFLSLIGRYKSAGTYDHIMADMVPRSSTEPTLASAAGRCFEIPATCQVGSKVR